MIQNCVDERTQSISGKFYKKSFSETFVSSVTLFRLMHEAMHIPHINMFHINQSHFSPPFFYIMWVTMTNPTL